MDERYVPKCKVVLLGESGVGKTCMVTRYISGIFEQSVVSTNGATFARKLINYPNLRKSLLLDIWDTSGQERYRSLTKIFYKDAAIVVLVYDTTSKRSFEEMTNYWYNELKNNNEKSSKFKLFFFIYFSYFSYWNCWK